MRQRVVVFIMIMKPKNDSKMAGLGGSLGGPWGIRNASRQCFFWLLKPFGIKIQKWAKNDPQNDFQEAAQRAPNSPQEGPKRAPRGSQEGWGPLWHVKYHFLLNFMKKCDVGSKQGDLNNTLLPTTVATDTSTTLCYSQPSPQKSEIIRYVGPILLRDKAPYP